MSLNYIYYICKEIETGSHDKMLNPKRKKKMTSKKIHHYNLLFCWDFVISPKAQHFVTITNCKVITANIFVFIFMPINTIVFNIYFNIIKHQ